MRRTLTRHPHPPVRRWAAAALSVAALALVAAGCGGDGTEAPAATGSSSAPEVVPHPDRLVLHLDQNRILRLGRTITVQVLDDAEGPVTVARAEVSSDRFDPVTWTGEETFEQQLQLELALPPTRCGSGSDADVTLTYRIGGGPWVRSTSTATDLYGSVGQLMDRDCAEPTFTEAAELELGRHEVVGTGRGSRFLLPVSIQATGERPEVAFAGFESTVLFTVAGTSGLFPDVEPVPLTAGTTFEEVLEITPSRCDAHALAEDKVGTLFPVHLTAPGLPEDASFHLPISDEVRGDLRAFFAPHCGI
ncbi:hypothetical protein [Nocardioides sp.]|uniref:hypothetical protein n=1 Tax=Nocardioides sp. TaxID=35761 RepID=UPI002604C359|nr:hypothetical protein [Nocardioides sp.]